MSDARLNVQGLARSEKDFMSCMVADPGYTIVSVDLSAGEPTATAHFSKDPNYYKATFGMVGKKPYYDGDLLIIDDIYLMTASRSPLAKDEIKEAFNSTYDGLTFSELWLKDPDAIAKGILKKPRKIHKPLCLGIGYGMGPKKMVTNAYNQGFTINLEDAKAFHRIYWDIYKEVKRLGNFLILQYKKQGYLENVFGYRLVPDSTHKCLNWFIQSTISGIINVLDYLFAQICSEALFVTVIHDELIYQIPTELLDIAKNGMQRAVNILNSKLNWSVKIRTGWQPGNNMYEAK